MTKVDIPRHCERNEAIQLLLETRWIASSLSLLAMTNPSPTGKSVTCLSSPGCKNIFVPVPPKSLLYPPPSRPERGAFRDRHGRRARDAVDVSGPADERPDFRT